MKKEFILLQHSLSYYVLEEDNIVEGRPYYYLTELAAKCTAKKNGTRLYFRKRRC